MSNHTRRDFLTTSLCSMPVIGATHLRKGVIAPVSDFKALVCVFLRGGNDGNNTVVPITTSQQSYAAYRAARESLALPERSLLAITTKSGDVYGLHPRLGALQSLFRRGHAAILANVGTLGAAEKLFSHSDQRDQWQSSLVGALARIAGPQLVKLDNGLQIGVSNAEQIQEALDAAPTMRTPFPRTQIASQFKTAARIIGVISQRGPNRAIFFSTLGGFDTHGAQLSVQDGLLAMLDQAIGALYSATAELGVSRQVTLFTASEFGRTLMPNSTAGTDHGWGNHHLIVGGAVRGGEIYGAFPRLERNGPDDDHDATIPTTSADQYSATLAKWFNPAGLSVRGPEDQNFATPDSGFLG